MVYAPLIAAALSLIEKMIPMIQSWRAAASQTNELTPQEEAEFQQRINDITSQDHWKID